MARTSRCLTITSLILLSFVLCVAVARPQRSSACPIQIFIEEDIPVMKLGSPYELSISISNLSSHKISYPVGWDTLGDYIVRIADSGGTVTDLAADYDGGSHNEVIEPGDSLNLAYSLNDAQPYMDQNFNSCRDSIELLLSEKDHFRRIYTLGRKSQFARIRQIRSR